ncbi:GNAT family N-acetyltransferase [Sporolactobacillus kofuensis]|uniref:GNAT family N-acetyltransferase n=1 Tax=Sporolactobacillus kofuensis TaxID=269672 RepID=A0ABW1WHZ9_9BACL|nr:GNAT family N-acetyltransferase [Sporolactobacillus kofuensis]MCO7176230.1 GNAT family N-acetyltransferase [Sporolactobacillus kofuensis]
MSSIRELKTVEEWKAAFPVIRQLRRTVNEDTYLELVNQASQNEGYHLMALIEQEQIVAVTGFMPMTTLYNGPSVWVCDLVTDEACRSKGYGKQLLDAVEQWAGAHGYSVISLSTGLQRQDAHRFYQEKMGYDKTSYVFRKELAE